LGWLGLEGIFQPLFLIQSILGSFSRKYLLFFPQQNINIHLHFNKKSILFLTNQLKIELSMNDSEETVRDYDSKCDYGSSVTDYDSMCDYDSSVIVILSVRDYDSSVIVIQVLEIMIQV